MAIPSIRDRKSSFPPNIASFVFCLLAIQLPCSCSTSGAVSANSALRDVQPEKSRLHIIRADVNGVAGNFVVDTGAGRSVLDERLAKRLGISLAGSVIGKTPNGNVRLKEFDFVEVKLGNGLVKSIRPTGTDLSSFESVTAESFDGILGVDVLAEGVLAIQGREVQVCKDVPVNFEFHEVLESKSEIADLAKLPIQISKSVKMEWQIDTGKRSCCRLKPELIALLESQLLVSKGTYTPITDLSGKRALKGHILKEVTIAGVRFRNVPVTPANDNAIGLGLLNHLNLVLDFPNRRILIGTPPKAEVDRFPLNASGMAVGFDKSGDLKILEIRPESVAAVAGIQVGEAITLLDNRNPADLSIDIVDEILARNGATISVRVGREGTSRIIELPLSLPIEYPPDWEAMEKDAAAFDEFLRDQTNREAANKPADN